MHQFYQFQATINKVIFLNKKKIEFGQFKRLLFTFRKKQQLLILSNNIRLMSKFQEVGIIKKTQIGQKMFPTQDYSHTSIITFPSIQNSTRSTYANLTQAKKTLGKGYFLSKQLQQINKMPSGCLQQLRNSSNQKINNLQRQMLKDVKNMYQHKYYFSTKANSLTKKLLKNFQRAESTSIYQSGRNGQQFQTELSKSKNYLARIQQLHKKEQDRYNKMSQTLKIKSSFDDQ